MSSRDFWETAMEGIRAYPLRSFLAILGIVIGIAAVTVVVTIGEASRREIEAEIQKLGSRLLEVGHYGSGGGSGRAFDDRDIGRIEQVSSLVEAVASEQTVTLSIRVGRQAAVVRVVGTDSNFSLVRHLSVQAGRFLSPLDLERERQVGVINQSARELLFPMDDSPMGKHFLAFGRQFEVIGLVADTIQQYGPEGAAIYLPLSTLRRFLMDRQLSNLWVLIREGVPVERGVHEVAAILVARHGDDAADGVRPISDLFEEEVQFTRTATRVISGIAAISLLVGGIGLMNTLLAGVRERVREVGIRRVVGATRRDLLVQFLLEGFILCFIGGVVGIVVGVQTASAIGTMLELPTGIFWEAPLMGVAISSAVGLIFSLYPAIIASRMDPITALKTE